MKILFLFFILAMTTLQAQNKNIIADPKDYLKEIKANFIKDWPDNKTINLVFHGHSVPAGYFVTPEVKTLDSYPFQVLKEVKKIYPKAVINVIVTAIGGENSKGGEKRFKSDVLNHKPDILFIDYALNDRPIGLKESKKAWESMIKQALKKNIKIILLTPSPDLKVKIYESNTILDEHTAQINELAKKYNIGLVDSYAFFKQIAAKGEPLDGYMAQFNHPNEKGHSIITNGIMEYFK
jgi:acyl-CoA thioesterase I